MICTFSLENVVHATAACNFLNWQLPKVVRTPQLFCILTWKRASRRTRLQFFKLVTSKRRPNPSVFEHFHLEMCFAPNARAIFQTCNFQKLSKHEGFQHFDLEMCFAPQRCAIFKLGTSKSGPNMFFKLATSKSGLDLWVFSHFDLKMRFAPQRRDIF